MTEVCRIPLGRSDHFAIVDAEDYAFLTQWLWSFKRSAWQYGGKFYARRHQRIDGQRTTIYMATLILTERKGIARPTDAHTVDHRDTDSLNNRRDNLRWATKAEQSSNQSRRINALERETFDTLAESFA